MLCYVLSQPFFWALIRRNAPGARRVNLLYWSRAYIYFTTLTIDFRSVMLVLDWCSLSEQFEHSIIILIDEGPVISIYDTLRDNVSTQIIHLMYHSILPSLPFGKCCPSRKRSTNRSLFSLSRVRIPQVDLHAIELSVSSTGISYIPILECSNPTECMGEKTCIYSMLGCINVYRYNDARNLILSPLSAFVRIYRQGVYRYSCAIFYVVGHNRCKTSTVSIIELVFSFHDIQK